jgi:membrane associated rhomboid family serine protease
MRRKGSRPRGGAKLWNVLLFGTLTVCLQTSIRIAASAKGEPFALLPFHSVLHDYHKGLGGGGLSIRGGDFFEANPRQLNTVLAPSVSYQNEHEEWLKQQQREPSWLDSNTHATPRGFNGPSQRRQRRQSNFREIVSRSATSSLDILQNYSRKLHRTSPSTYWTTLTCLSIFLVWTVTPQLPLLQEFFLCSRTSIHRSRGLSLILSAVSHKSFGHLLANLVTFVQFATKLRIEFGKKIGVPSHPLLPLFLGSALCSNLLFVSVRTHGSCLGLSGVTMATLAVYACTHPAEQLRVGFIPFSFPAGVAVWVLLVVSMVGSFAPSSTICHLGHLGGLLYGIAYFQWTNNNHRRGDILRSRHRALIGSLLQRK